MIPIPKYLKPITEIVEEEKNGKIPLTKIISNKLFAFSNPDTGRITLNVKCPCGCDKFILALKDPSETDDDYVVIKAVCTKCHKEHVIFDCRFHGYNSSFIPKEVKNKKYIFNNYFTEDSPVSIQIKLYNSKDMETFLKTGGEEKATKEEYANGFEWIKIYLIHNGKKKKILDYETA